MMICATNFVVAEAQAQSFTPEKDVAKIAASGYVDLYNNITNTTSDTITIAWKVIDHNMPQSWVDDAAFGLCDNVTCYDKNILSGSTQVTDTVSGVSPNNKMLFKVQIDVSSPTVSVTNSDPIYLDVELINGSTTDTVRFEMFKWSTNVSKIEVKEDVTLFPNPAKDKLNISYPKSLNVKSIAIYNLVGKQLKSYKVNSNNVKIDIEQIPSGIYFTRLIDNTGRVVATRRFTHQ